MAGQWVAYEVIFMEKFGANGTGSRETIAFEFGLALEAIS